MDTRHRALLALELRRTAPGTFRFLAVVALITLVATLVGQATPDTLAMVWTGLTTGYVVQLPLAALRDKIEGGMEFLCNLPIPRSGLATARLLAGGVLALPAAAHLFLAAWYVFPLLELHRGALSLLSIFGIAWIGFAAIINTMTALIIRYRIQDLTSTPLVIATLGGLGFVMLLDRLVPDPQALLRTLLHQWWLPPMVVGILLAGSLLLLAIARWVMIRGFTGYTPRGDSISW